MKTVRDNIVRCLDYYRDEEELLVELDKIIKSVGDSAYNILLNVLSHLELETDEAKECWNNIIEHRLVLNEVLGRPVSIRTAICDYFCSIRKSMKSPVVVEIHVFEKVVRDSKYDDLTGLFNRRSFDEILAREISKAMRHKTDLSLLFIDIDDFKKVNDNYGHQFGDEVLKRVAEVIVEAGRVEDISARYGGEEMVVIMPHTPKLNGLILSERIREKVGEMEMDYEGTKVGVTISGGLAALPINAIDAKGLIECADNAVYHAKGAGKNQIALFSSHDQRRFQRIDLDRDVQVREFTITNADVKQVKSKDISIGGILFKNTYSMDIGTKIQLSLNLNTDKPINIVGTVVRVEEFGPEDYDIGVMSAFMDIDKEVKNEVSQYLIKHLQATGGDQQPDV